MSQNRPFRRRTGPPQSAAAPVAPAPATRKPVEHPKPAGPIELPDSITVRDLANLINVSSIDVVKNLMRNGIMATVNQPITFDVAKLVARVWGIEAVKAVQETGLDKGKAAGEEDASKLRPRPPVVTILGHVDHGKTTLLDAIRRTRVAEGEVGGITQHIGAYQVEYKGQTITFLDTPGHEAFTAMRARGAKMTDIAILVVAADDGVMPQTVEALNHAKAAGVPIVVAINKMDRPGADPERVKRQLSEQGLIFEEWGGDVIAVPVSAKQRQGIGDLLENILVVAEVGEYKANPDRPASGAVAEARLDQSRGPVCTVLVQNGTLNIGDIIVAGAAWGRVKALFSDTGRRMKSAGPATPVEVLGLDTPPEAGDTFQIVADERTARGLAEEKARAQSSELSRMSAISLEDVYSRISSGEVKSLNLILKADVQGSIEAIRQALEKLSTDKVRIRFIHTGSGNVTESDVLLAAASGAIILGFTVRSEGGAEPLAARQGIQIRYYDIIYRIVEDVEKALQGILEPEYREVVEGRAEVRQIFPGKKELKVAGCMVAAGKVTRGATARVIRGGNAIYNGKVEGMRRFKDEVNEVAAGFECGIRLERFNDIQEGDVIETVRMQRV